MTLRSVCGLIALGVILTWPVSVSAQAGLEHNAAVRPGSPNAPAIVIGFVGGYIAHDSAVHGGVIVAADLRKEYPSGVDVEVFENHRGRQAYQTILGLADADHDGTLSAEEKRSARIILYGHSWGASEAIGVARKLEANGVPVLLTIQVDSVRKRDEDDSTIPANVAQAVNFYQSTGLLHGERQIRAADSTRTRIIGNIKFDYAQHPVECAGYPWYARAFEKPHIEIECDPAVITQVESLIRSALGTGLPASELLRPAAAGTATN
jgi:hypothetical protein